MGILVRISESSIVARRDLHFYKKNVRIQAEPKITTVGGGTFGKKNTKKVYGTSQTFGENLEKFRNNLRKILRNVEKHFFFKLFKS